MSHLTTIVCLLKLIGCLLCFLVCTVTPYWCCWGYSTLIRQPFPFRRYYHDTYSPHRQYLLNFQKDIYKIKQIQRNDDTSSSTLLYDVKNSKSTKLLQGNSNQQQENDEYKESEDIIDVTISDSLDKVLNNKLQSNNTSATTISTSTTTLSSTSVTTTTSSIPATIY